MIVLAYILFGLCGFSLLTFLAVFLSELRCGHHNVQWPIRGKERCLDCLRVRDYEFGAKPGRWKREKIAN